MTTLTPGKLLRLRRLADDSGRFKMLAVDQRPPIERLVSEARGTDTASFADVAMVKRALLQSLGELATAVLVDPQYLFPAVIPLLPPGRGVLVTLEDDSFEETPEGRLSSAIPDWSVEKIQASGGDGVKVLAWYRPDASPAVKESQQQFVARIGEECSRRDMPFVFELLLYPFPGEGGHTTEYVEQPGKRADHVIESVAEFAKPSYGVDLFKLESPFPAVDVASGAVASKDAEAAFDSLADAAGRPWVMLSAGADQQSFRSVLEHAFAAGASGFLAGRAIWWESCRRGFPDPDTLRANLEDDAASYFATINTLADQHATPWFEHASYGDEGPVPPAAGAEFRAGYLR